MMQVDPIESLRKSCIIDYNIPVYRPFPDVEELNPLNIDPNSIPHEKLRITLITMPSQWRGLTFQICFRGARVRLQLDADEARVTTDRPVRFAVGAGQPTTISNGTAIPLGEGRQRPLG
jgi:hypothetical protein